SKAGRVGDHDPARNHAVAVDVVRLRRFKVLRGSPPLVQGQRLATLIPTPVRGARTAPAPDESRAVGEVPAGLPATLELAAWGPADDVAGPDLVREPSVGKPRPRGEVVLRDHGVARPVVGLVHVVQPPAAIIKVALHLSRPAYGLCDHVMLPPLVVV